MTELLPNAAENLIKLREICDASAKKILQLAQVMALYPLKGEYIEVGQPSYLTTEFYTRVHGLVSE